MEPFLVCTAAGVKLSCSLDGTLSVCLPDGTLPICISENSELGFDFRIVFLIKLCSCEIPNFLEPRLELLS